MCHTRNGTNAVQQTRNDALYAHCTLLCCAVLCVDGILIFERAKNGCATTTYTELMRYVYRSFSYVNFIVDENAHTYHNIVGCAIFVHRLPYISLISLLKRMKFENQTRIEKRTFTA